MDVRAAVNRKEWRIGKASLFAVRPSAEVIGRVQALEAYGKTVVLIGDDRVLGLIAVQDTDCRHCR
jgi:cation transport ATPase